MKKPYDLINLITETVCFLGFTALILGAPWIIQWIGG